MNNYEKPQTKTVQIDYLGEVLEYNDITHIQQFFTNLCEEYKGREVFVDKIQVPFSDEYEYYLYERRLETPEEVQERVQAMRHREKSSVEEAKAKMKELQQFIEAAEKDEKYGKVE